MLKLIPYFTKETKESKIYLDWFTENFLVSDFKGVEAMLFAFLDYCSEYGITPTEKILLYFLKESGKTTMKSNKIYPDRMTVVDYSEPTAVEESFRIISNLCVDKWTTAMIESTEIDFLLVAGSYMNNLASEEAQELMMQHFGKLGDGSFKFTDFYSDVQSIEIKLGEDKLDDLKIRLITEARYKDSEEEEENERDKTKKGMRLLFKTRIPAVDNDMGGFYSKQLWALSGQPGSGKTREAMADFVWNCAVVAKKGVLVDQLELTRTEVENILIAYHIIHLYGGKVKIPDNLINRGLLTEAQQQYVEAARLDLFESGKYGRIIIREKDVVSSKLRAELMKFFKMNPDIEFYVMDYVGLAEDEKPQFGRGKMSYECIRECYKVGKWIAKKMDIGVLYLNQFTADGIEKALSGKQLNAGDIEGGQIVHRHSDYVLDMTYTEEQKAANMRMLSTSKVRSATGFQNVAMNVDLSVSIFRQVMLQ